MREGRAWALEDRQGFRSLVTLPSLSVTPQRSLFASRLCRWDFSKCIVTDRAKMNPSGRKVCDVPGSGPAVVGTLTPVGSHRLAVGLVATQLLHHCWAEPQGSVLEFRGSASASQGALSRQAARPALPSLPVRMRWWCRPVGCADVGGRVRRIIRVLTSFACN